jgi:ATP-dependent Lon protease
VLPIGGVKAKAIAARRAGYRTLLFPEASCKDVGKLP